MTEKQKQHLLAYLGYYTGSIDGDWGILSQTAARNFQKDFGGLTVDGIVGEQTQQALKRAVANGMPETSAPDTENFWEHIQYWSREEFRCQCGGKYCDGFPTEPDRTLVELVDELRARAGRPGHRSSGLRCRTWNAIQGGVSNSKHMTGKALDFYIEGLSGGQLLTLARSDPRTSYAYIIEGPYVHVDVA